VHEHPCHRSPPQAPMAPSAARSPESGWGRDAGQWKTGGRDCDCAA
jgi:hypothetical protein